MRWLITGGCGFIGTALVERLTEEGGHVIRVVDNLSVGKPEDLERVCTFSETKAEYLGSLAELSGEFDVELIVGDIMDEALALKVCQGADVVVHLAANTGVEPSVKDPRRDCMTNVIGTLNYLEAARHNEVGRFVFASSGAPVGECEPPIHEDLAPHPVSPYGASKLAGEGYCSAYYRTFGIETVALRFGNVYGPGSNHKSSVVAKFIKRALAGEPLEIYGDGSQTRDFIFISDLIDAILKSATIDEIGGEVFQIASNCETSVNQLLDLIAQMCKFQGMEIETSKAPMRVGDVAKNYSKTEKALRILNWKTQKNLNSGLYSTLVWFKENSSNN